MKKKLTTCILIASILLTLILSFIYLRFDRFKLINCLKDAEGYRKELMEKAELTPDKIISIEQATDKKRNECYVLYK